MAKARKPTLAAWVVNQLARRERRQISALLRSGDRLRAAGTDRSKVAAATERQRTVVNALVDAARDLTDGPTGTQLDRVRETLHAAAVDQEVGRQLKTGRLTREQRAVGFAGLLAPSSPTASRSPAAKPDGKRAGQARRELAQAQGRLSRAQREREGAVARVRQAEARLEREQALAEEADRELEAAREAMRRAAASSGS